MGQKSHFTYGEESFNLTFNLPCWSAGQPALVDQQLGLAFVSWKYFHLQAPFGSENQAIKKNTL